jgi:hypothetical protein
MSSVTIPPKTLEHYVMLAKDGKAVRYSKNGKAVRYSKDGKEAIFYNSRQEISIMDFNGESPFGFARQMTSKEWDNRHIPPKELEIVAKV